MKHSVGWRRPLTFGVCDFAKRRVGAYGSFESAWGRAHCGRACPRQSHTRRESLREIADPKVRGSAPARRVTGLLRYQLVGSIMCASFFFDFGNPDLRPGCVSIILRSVCLETSSSTFTDFAINFPFREVSGDCLISEVLKLDGGDDGCVGGNGSTDSVSPTVFRTEFRLS